MSEEIKYEKCPHCGSKENVIGKQDGYAAITPNKIFTMKQEAIYHVICLNCGTIIRSYVKEPRKLVIKKEH